uniref:SPATA31-like domain-containing protein n=1 Tax=Equus asinus TaxID=9793 RepID=A0A8C4LP06_EQUAS
MLSPTFVLWDAGRPLYTYGSIIIIASIMWKKSRWVNPRGCRPQGLQDRGRAGPVSRAHASKDADVTPSGKNGCRVSLPSQGWLPEEGSVRWLLCADPSCPVCNAVALEIQQLLWPLSIAWGTRWASVCHLQQKHSYLSMVPLSCRVNPWPAPGDLCTKGSPSPFPSLISSSFHTV